MQIYPHNSAIILNNTIYSEYGGLGTGSFSQAQLNSSYWLAEMQVSSYIGTLLLPTTITGTYGYAGANRLATDYGYVHQILSVNVVSQQSGMSCSVQGNDGCAFIFNDTFGYIDFQRISSVCACGYPFWNPTYQVQIAYQAGLPTGTANQPGILEALTIVAQIDLNEKSPGTVGINEGQGDIGIQSFRSLDYAEIRGAHSIVKTALGESPKAMRAKRLLDMSIMKARRVLFA